LILPADVTWGEGGEVGTPKEPPASPPIDPSAVEGAARMLRGPDDVLLLLAGGAVLGEAQRLAWRIAKATGATLMADFVNARLERGRGRLPLERVPYARDEALAALGRFRQVVLVNARPPVTFFG